MNTLLPTGTFRAFIVYLHHPRGDTNSAKVTKYARLTHHTKLIVIFAPDDGIQIRNLDMADRTNFPISWPLKRSIMLSEDECCVAFTFHW